MTPTIKRRLDNLAITGLVLVLLGMLGTYAFLPQGPDAVTQHQSVFPPVWYAGVACMHLSLLGLLFLAIAISPLCFGSSKNWDW